MQNNQTQQVQTLHQVIEEAKKCYPGLKTISAAAHYSLILNKVIHHSPDINKVDAAFNKYQLLKLILNPLDQDYDWESIQLWDMEAN